MLAQEHASGMQTVRKRRALLTQSYVSPWTSRKANDTGFHSDGPPGWKHKEGRRKGACFACPRPDDTGTRQSPCRRRCGIRGRARDAVEWAGEGGFQKCVPRGQLVVGKAVGGKIWRLQSRIEDGGGQQRLERSKLPATKGGLAAPLPLQPHACAGRIEQQKENGEVP